MDMSRPKSDVEHDKTNIFPAEAVNAEDVHLLLTPKTEGSRKPGADTNGFLAAPLSAPFRPLSPDTLSIFSMDEYEQLGLSPSHQQTVTNQDSDFPTTSPKGLRGKLRAFWTHNKGCAYMLFAQFFGTLMNVTARLLEVEGNNGKGLHPFQILFARMSVTLVLASAWMWYHKTPHFPLGAPEVRWLLFARGFGGFFGVYGMYYSLLYLPLADATVITFLAPGLASWACSILIHEPFTRIEQIGSFVSLVGVVLIARPTSIFQALLGPSPPVSGNGDVVPGNNTTVPASGGAATSYDHVTSVQRLGAVGVALIGVLGAATAYTTIKWIGKRAHPLISVNYFSAWCLIVSTTMQLIVPSIGFLLPANLREWGLLLFLGFCGFVMQCFLVAALSYEKSSRTTNLIYTQMLFALGFDKLIFGHTPGLLSILGSSLILGSAIVVTARKGSGVKAVPEGSTAPIDEESGQRLIGDMVEPTDGLDQRDQIPMQEVRLRDSR